MPRIYTSVSEATLAKLQALQQQGHKSFSSTVNKMIESGIEFSEENTLENGVSTSKKQAELEDRHTEYLLRLIGISSDVLRCVYDEKKSINSGKSADETLDTIKYKIQSFVDGFLEKSP